MTDPMPAYPGLAVSRAATEPQWLLHADPDDAATLAAATGLRLPAAMLTSASGDGWTALHLSPDEWLLVGDAEADGGDLAARLEAVAVAHSLVDVSDRSIGLILKGPLAIAALAAGCPLDLERLPDGHCTRTLFGKVTVLLRRMAGDAWRLDYARSYDGYATGLVDVAARDAAEAPLSA